MAQQLHVNLNFTADATQAKSVLQSLSQNLTEIASITPINGQKLSQEMSLAKNAAKDLQQHLINAFNVKTGNLDLSKLDASLKASGQSIGELSANLLRAGTTGQQAFLNIQRSITNASVQINQANGALAQFWTTMKNTAKWQISSSILHGFIGGLQSAWGYAKELDKSLNNIRIVTGYSTERMAEFAEQANKAAKALSTTTTDYTNASLIYYQQGLSDKEILERTEITIKMANATGQSAQVVSDQLTAIWNNFDDGSKSLEYYVDAVTALGAATASSTDEIAQGLEKFASVAETVGLSYEYATAALATVTATTRQSADVVGTAFKTLFARLQDLKLGETLDDGTTLGQYTEHLAKVGVNIKTASGELKNMDQILDETAAKWSQLDKDQQVALAKGVAGIRQYNQFISLMSHWDYMKENLKVIEQSGGTLQKQADIYAESWEASIDRVKASAEGIYRQLFPTEELTGLADGFAVFLQGVEGVVRGLGGLEGILLLISSIVLNVFQNQIGNAINNVIGKFSSLTGITHTLRSAFQGTVVSTLQTAANLNTVAASTGNAKAQAELMTGAMSKTVELSRDAAIATAEMGGSFEIYSANLVKVNNIQALIEQSTRFLTQEDRERLSLLQQQALAANEQLLAAEQMEQTEKNRYNILIQQRGAGLENANNYGFFNRDNTAMHSKKVFQPADDQNTFSNNIMASKENIAGSQQMLEVIQAVRQEHEKIPVILGEQNHRLLLIVNNDKDIIAMNQEARQVYGDMVTLQTKIAQAEKTSVNRASDKLAVVQKIVETEAKSNPLMKELLKTYGLIDDEGNAIENDVKVLVQKLTEATNGARTFARVTGDSSSDLNTIRDSAVKVVGAMQNSTSAAENFHNKVNQISTSFSNALSSAMNFGRTISSMASGFSTVAMGISSVVNAIETLKDEDASFATKLTAGAMAATMGLSALTTVIGGLNSVMNSLAISTNVATSATERKAAAETVATLAQRLATDATDDNTKAELVNILTTKLGVKQDEAEAKAEALVTLAKKGETGATIQNTAANWANVASQAAKLWYIALIVAAIAALIAIIVAVTNKESEEEQQVKRTAAAYESMREEMEKSKSAAEDIKAAFDEYTTIVDKLKACTKGTKEWNELLTEVQNKVFEIMRDFPELATKYENLFVRDPATEMLVVDESQIEKIVSDYTQASSIDSFQATVSMFRAQQASLDQQATYLIPSNKHGDGYTIVRTSEPTETTKTVEYNYQELLRNNIGDLAYLSENKFKEVFIDLLQDTGDSVGRTEVLSSTDHEYTSVSVTDLTERELDALADAAFEYRDVIDEIADKTQQYAEAIDTAYDLITQQLIPEKDSDTQNLTSAALQEEEAKYKKAYYALMTSNQGDKGGRGTKYEMSASEASKTLTGTTSLDVGIAKTDGSDNKIYKYILKELQKYGKAWTAHDNGVLYQDHNRELQFYDEEGKAIKKGAEWIAQELATSRALAEINNSVKTAEDLLQDINTNIDKADFGTNKEGQQNAFKSLMTNQNLESVSVNDINSLYDAIDGLQAKDGTITKGIGDKELTKEEVSAYLDKIIGDGKDGTISESTAKKHGFDNAADMVDTYYRNLKAAGQSIKNFAIKGIEEIDQLTLGAAESLNAAFSNINLGPSGIIAGQKFVNGINTMLDTVKDESRVALLEQLAGVDWSSYDALERAAEIVKQFGGEINIASTEWSRFAKEMRIAALATPDYSKLKNDLIGVSKILKDLKFGSALDEEDYLTLINYNKAWEKFFVLQADGTRKFIGNEKDLQQATRDTVKAKQKELAEDKKHAQALKTAKVDATFDDSELEKSLGGDGQDGLFSVTSAAAQQEGGTNAILRQQGYKVDEKSGKVYLSGEEVNQEEYSASVMAYQRGAKVEDMLAGDQGEVIKQALADKGYTESQIREIIAHAKGGHDERLKVMMNELDNLMTQDYDALDAEYQQLAASTAENSQELKTMFENGEIGVETFDAQLSAMANSATSLEELQGISSTAAVVGEGDDQKAYGLDQLEYGEALMTLGGQYDNCTKEIEEYERALLAGNEATQAAAQENLEAAIAAGELAKQYGLDAQEIEDYSKRLQAANKNTKLSGQEATRLATANMRLDRGLSNLNDNFDDYKKALKDNNKGSAEWSKTMSDLKTDLADILGVADGSMLSDSFAKDVMASDDLEKALDGDADAILRLQTLAADDVMVNIVANQSQTPETIKTMWQQLKDDFAAIDDIDAPEVNQENLLNSFNAMIKAGNMTKEQIETALSGLHVSANVKTTYVTQKQQVPLTITESTWMENGTMQVPVGENEDGSVIYKPYTSMRQVTKTYNAGTDEADVVIPQYEIEGTTGEGGNTVAFTSAPPPQTSHSSTKSGKAENKSSSSKSKKTSEAKQKKSDTVERYKKVNDQLDDTQRAMDKASKAADRLYGPARLKQMQKVNEQLETEIDLLKEKQKEAEKYLQEDKRDLDKAASDVGLSFTYDENGNISNYEEQMTKRYNDREALLKSFGDTMDEAEQEKLDAFDAKTEALTDAISTYDDTRETKEDIESEIDDTFYEWQDNNYEQLSYKLELQMEINDRDLEVLDYYFAKTEDDFYKRAEGLAYLTEKTDVYNEKLADNEAHLADLQRQYAAGEISQANYVAGLKEVYTNTKADAEALQNLDKQMLNYYGETLDMAAEELSKYTSRMEHQTATLEHFKNTMDILGKSNDHKAMGIILDGQAKTIKNELTVAQKTYEMYSSEAAKKKALWEQALADGDTAAAKLYQKEWEAAEEKSREAQDEMLSKTEEWAESMKAILENKLAGLAQTLENALTGGTSFDTLTTQMERAASLQEEYLTTTNKIYETNKMINTAQKEIDKSTNTVAKQKLKSFQQETAQLQNKSKLSQYELDIQQAKYELLLAEIALEESQQAKSTVRLQRDSEGNFGYVYTADANAVADAEQKLADAQNNLYNIGLDGANDYAQKYQQIMQEMTDTLKDITEKYRNGEYESEEEYHQAMEEAKAYYFQKLQDYSNLYQVALTTDSRVIADAWSTDFGIMTTKTEDWKKAVNKYLSEVNGAFEGWEKVVKRVKAETVGQDLDALKDKTQAIVDVSADLSEQITKKGGVIDSIEAEMAAVSAITSTYTQWGQAIAATIAANEKLMHQTNAIIAEQSGGKSSVSSKDVNLETNNKDKGNATANTAGVSGNNNTGSKQPSLVDGSRVTVKKTARHFSRDGGNGTKMQDWVPGYTFTVIDIDGNEVLIGKGSSYSQATGWVRKTDLEGFKTGGYTGSWGSEGKLAMLHQKELILNADDTANFLASLEILREIINVIDLHSANAQLSGLLSSPAYRDYNEPQTLEQQVHIEASFPNVQDRHEIEEAFTNLVNRASQFVNRK